MAVTALTVVTLGMTHEYYSSYGGMGDFNRGVLLDLVEVVMKYWIMIQQIAGPEGHMPWAVGYLDGRTGSLTSIEWFYTEDAARLAHHRLTN